MDNLPPSALVPLSPSLRKRFYEPTIVLFCLIAACVSGGATELVEAGDDLPKSRKGLYFAFVDKLSQACDSKRGGDETTSFAILQPGRVEYWFASNQRNANALTRVKDYVTDILNTLGSTTLEDVEKSISNQQTPIGSKLLRMILGFHRGRIQSYLKHLPWNLRVCIDEVSNEDAGDSQDALAGLKTLNSLLDSTGAELKVSEDELLDRSEAVLDRNEALVRAMKSIYLGPLRAFVVARCQTDHGKRLDSSWQEIRHSFERLLSYHFAVKIFLTARKEWPELFVDFEVVPLPSSRPDRDPPSIRKSADKIIPRMTTDNSVLNVYRKNAETFKKWGLDNKIKEATHHSKFKLIVHAEIVVDDSIRREERRLESDGEEDPLRFLLEDEFGRYIGSSKPTCRLCAWYFDAQPDGVQVRPSHQSVYPNWRPADIFESDGVKVEKQRNAVLEHMVLKLRNNVFKVIRDKAAAKNRFDSNNAATNPFKTSYLSPSVAGQDGSADITSRMAALSVSESHETTPVFDSANAVKKDLAAHASDGNEEDGEHDAA